MKVGSARAAAADWVLGRASQEPGFLGAYFSGSTVGLADDAQLPATSDVDVVLVTAQPKPGLKPGKFRHHGTLVEASYLPWDQLASAEHVLGTYYLAGSFRTDTIIADPAGRLSRLHSQVSGHFADRAWVRRRCENARQRIENGLRAIDPSAPWHQQVTGWLFPTGVTTHVLLAAALRNPTVRLRYLAARGVLSDYGHVSVYEELLSLLGCAAPQRVEHHLAELARTFDAAAAVARTPFSFSTDITALARPIAIGGSRALIRAGWHREAVFWMTATFARCQMILAADAAPLQRALAPAFDAITADLGVVPGDGILRRTREVWEFLPRLWETAEKILSANPGIVAT